MLDFYSASHLIISTNPISTIISSLFLILPFHFHLSIFQYFSSKFSAGAVNVICIPSHLDMQCIIPNLSPKFFFCRETLKQKGKNGSCTCLLKMILFQCSNAFFKTLLKMHKPFLNKSKPKRFSKFSNSCIFLLPCTSGHVLYLQGKETTFFIGLRSTKMDCARLT